jgi:acyl carrier protein
MEDMTITPVAARQRVFDCIYELLPQVLDRQLPAVQADTKLMAELGMRSASMLELLVALEEALDIAIDVEDIGEAGMSTVGDLADFVASHSAAAE